MIRYLFLLTITPVQSFIMAARKTQDLYAGSYILSHLCRTAINRAKNQYNARIIMPHSDIKSLPNRFLAVFDTENERKLKNIGLDIEHAILKEIENMVNQIIYSLGIPFHKDLLEQVNNYFQIYWTFYPLEGKNYAEVYKQIEASLGSTKNIRKFRQLVERGTKCSITGEHNILYYKYSENKKKAIKDAIPVADEIPVKYLAPGEALGGIAFIKRCAGRVFGKEFNNRFPSTSRVAIMNALNKLAMKDSEYYNILDMDFAEQDVYNLKNGAKTVDDKVAENVYKKLEQYKINYSSYYAILLFDGDSMGAWLSGEKIKNKALLEKLQEFHSYLSQRLSNFAKLAAEQVLVPPRGISVYAGGDDFLGFVNLDYLLEVMKELREKFESIVDLSKFTGEKLAFSAGVAVAHFKTPLAEVLTWARKMEKEAKKMDDAKDAFGLALLKHSGEICKSIYKWKCDDKWTTDMSDKLISYLGNRFSPSFIKTFQLEFRPLLDVNGSLDPEKISDGMVKSELKRLMDRAYLDNNNVSREQNQAEKKEKIKDLLDTLWALYLNSRYFSNFISLLDFTVFMEREGRGNA